MAGMAFHGWEEIKIWRSPNLGDLGFRVVGDLGDHEFQKVNPLVNANIEYGESLVNGWLMDG